MNEEEAELYEKFMLCLYKPSNEAFNKMFGDLLINPLPKNLLPEYEQITENPSSSSRKSMKKSSGAEKKSKGSSKPILKKGSRFQKRK